MKSYQNKYLKYKNKYLKLKQQIGGMQLTLYDLNDKSKNTKYFIDFDEDSTLYQIEMQLRAQLTKNKIDFDDIKFYEFNRNMCLPTREVNQIDKTTDSQIKDLCFKTIKHQVLKPIKMVTGFNNDIRPINDQEGMFYHKYGIFKGKIVSGYLDYDGYVEITEGTGILIKSNGIQYTGNFINNELIKGIMTNSNGTIFEGNFENSVLNGTGKKTTSVYVDSGIFVDGVLNGIGTRNWNDESSEEGEFENGELNGKGKKKWNDGSSEEGDFVNGQLNGEGKKKWNDGSSGASVYEGKFVNGDLISGKKTFSDKYYIEGTFKDGKLNGKGTTNYENGYRTEGKFVNGQLNGMGKRTEPDGKVYEGEFRDDEMFSGKEIHSDGKV